MLEIPERIWKRIKGYSKPQKAYRTNHENVLCWQTVRRADKKKVVIKLFEWEIIEEYKDELKSVADLKRINIRNLVKVYDIKEDEDLGIYYVMEYWGKDLREMMEAPLRQDWIIDIIKQLLEVVTELHRHKRVHRDIKPENTFLNKNYQVKLGDYGLIKSQRVITQLATIAGTRDYMAPEILTGKPYDKRCDIYSTGIVLLELLTGVRELSTKKPDDIPDGLWEVVLKATENDPDKRFATADEFIKTLAEKQRLISKPIYIDLEKYKKKSPKKIIPSKPKEVLSQSEPISQNLDIRRRTPDTDRSRQTIDSGILVKTLQTQFDELVKTADTQKALEIGGELLHAVEQRFGPKDPHTADVLDALAELNLRKGAHRTAWELYHRSLAIDTDTFGRPSREMIRSLFNEAGVLLKESKFDESVKTYQQALLATEKAIGKDQPQTVVILNNLAGAYYGDEEYAKAQEFYQQALRINEQKFGRTHETVAVNLYNLALTYEAMDKKEAAEPLAQRAREIGEKVFKPDDPRLKMMRKNLKEENN